MGSKQDKEAFLKSSDEEKFATASRLLRYEDGLLYWNARRQNIQVGDRIDCHCKQGYVVLGLFGRVFYAHTFVWLLCNKEWPSRIDHINRVKDDNRIENLRTCTVSQNASNRTKTKMTLSGYTGVVKKSDRYFAQIRHDSKTNYLGMFDTAELAAIAYDKACVAKHGEFATTNFEVPS